MGDERDGTKGCAHYERLDFDWREVLETATFVVGILFLSGKAPPGVVGSGDGTALNARLGVLWPKERVEVVVGSFERSGLFEAPMTTLLHGRAPTSLAVVRVGSVAGSDCFRPKPRTATGVHLEDRTVLSVHSSRDFRGSNPVRPWLPARC
jgi:hypothetical protein